MVWLARKIIHHDPTKDYIYKGDKALMKLIPDHKSLFHSGEGKGLPIGNLTSQFFANVYLDALDQFITKGIGEGGLGLRNYARYVDDFVIVHRDKEALLGSIKRIRSFLKESLDLDLHPDKIRLQETRKGIDFLGYFVKPTHTLVRQSVVRRFKEKLNRRRDQDDGLLSIDDIAMIQSYLGHFGHADSYRLKRKLGE